MLHRPRYAEVPVPIERDARCVYVTVTGDIGHGLGSAAAREDKPNGLPMVSTQMDAFFPIQPGDIGIRELVDNPVHRGGTVPGRDKRALAGAVRSDLVKPHDEPGSRSNPECDAEGARDGFVRRRVSRFEPYAKYFMRLARSRQPRSSRVVSSVVSVPTNVPSSRKRNVQIRPNCFSTESSRAFVVWS